MPGQTRARIRAASAMVLEPGSSSTIACTEFLHGETLQLLDRPGPPGTALRVRADLDGYEGLVQEHELQGIGATATHRVAVRASLVFVQPDIKTPVHRHLPLGSLLAIANPDDVTQEGLVRAEEGWVLLQHLEPVTSIRNVTLGSLALNLYLGAPYVWGGRAPTGCDCSGLVQSVARLCGHALPRDSGPQEAAITQQIAPGEYRADDLVFWPGHVAIALDAGTVVHANAYTMSVATEPLDAVVARAGSPSSVRRLPPPALK